MNRRVAPLRVWVLAALLLALFAPAAAFAAPAPSEFASLSRDKVFLREGPSYQHRILWIYRRKDLPVEIVARYDVWRRVRDAEGTVGWVHSSMLSPRRSILVTAKSPVPVRNGAPRDSKVIATAQPGVVARLEACEAHACEIAAGGVDGWIEKQNIWGVGAGETF